MELKAWGWRPSLGTSGTAGIISRGKGLHQYKEGAFRIHTLALKEKMQREMMLGMGAEGARGWRLDSKK